MAVRIRVSDRQATIELQRHLEEQGFPARRASVDELDVLFPGDPGIFASATELDVWGARHAGVTVTFVPAPA